VESAVANPILLAAGSTPVEGCQRIAELARRPRVSVVELLEGSGLGVDADTAGWAEIELKYAGYLVRERAAAGRLSQMDKFPLPEELAYEDLTTLSFEARQKLAVARPESLGQAGRIPGVSPSDLQSLVMEVLKLRR
jgi:tRNA uridine 5-carboxymethylaminomethyl modification enzyme